MTACPHSAFLRIGGVDVAVLRCHDFEGHADHHSALFTWDDAGIEWPEAHDPDEGFDVEVDALPHEAVVDARIEQQSVGDDLAIEHSHEAIETTARARLDVILDEHRERLRRQANDARRGA